MRAARRFAVPLAGALVVAASAVSVALTASNPETDKSEEFEGKTFTMFAFQAATVFVKKG